MARQLMTVCVLCLLCTTHAQCASSRSLSSSLDYTSPQELRPLRTRRSSFIYGRRIRRDLPTTDHDRDLQNSHLESISPLQNDGEVEVQLRRLFAEFGDPTLMTLNFKEFSRLVQSGRLASTLSSSQASKLQANFSESKDYILEAMELINLRHSRGILLFLRWILLGPKLMFTEQWFMCIQEVMVWC